MPNPPAPAPAPAPAAAPASAAVTPTIRIATFDDYAPACALLDEVDRLHREQLPWLFQTPSTQPRSAEFFESLLDDAKSTVLVAEMPTDASATIIGVAIGYLRTAPEFGVFIPQQWGVLDAIAVSPPWRRHGAGRALVHGIEQWAHALGARWVELGVYDFNAGARRFYEQLGYLPLSTKLRKPR